MKKLLSGNEGIALGAYEAGVKVVTGYPETPSTEITETLSKYKDIYTEGITKISAIDIKYANACGRSIKLLASGRRDGDDVYAMVAPFMIDTNNPLYMVNDVYNGVLVKSNMLGDTMYYGKGAGKLPTASAVVADMIDAARHKGTTAKFLWDKEKLEVADMSKCKNRFFVRMRGDQMAVMEKAAEYFGSVQAVPAVEPDEAAFITEPMEEAAFAAAAEKAGGILNRIRVK